MLQASMSKVEGESENIAEAIAQENANSISKIRSLLVDIASSNTPCGNAEVAKAPLEKLPDSEA